MSLNPSWELTAVLTIVEYDLPTGYYSSKSLMGADGRSDLSDYVAGAVAIIV